MSSVEDRYREALSLYERDEFARAAAAFEEVLASCPAHVEARYKLANSRKDLCEWQAADRHYREVLELDPGHAEALNNLGAVCQARERLAEAETCYRRAIQCKPELAQPYLNLGRLLQMQARDREACDSYRQALAQGLDPGLFGHLLKAATGGASPKAPLGYVRETFDAFAGQFDRYLVHELGYRVPEQLAGLARRFVAGRRLEILDLGCGTGLAGESFAPLARSLVGVDASPRMLEAARRRGCYDALHAAEIEDWLAKAPPESFDLALAADVFIYIGDLREVFCGVARCLRPMGAFAFSVESCAGVDWCLLASGRYAQSAAYLSRLAGECGFDMLGRERATLRRGIEGELFWFQKKR